MLTPFIPQPKPPFPYDRPLSHSQLSCFEYRPSEWYSRYVLNEKQEVSREMAFGFYVDKRIQDNSAYLPGIVRLDHQQYELKTTIEDIPLIGYPDQLSLEKPELRDTKTGRKPWDKSRANKTNQLTMYLLMIYLIHKIPPQKFRCFIDWLPTCVRDGEVAFVEPVQVKTIETKRSMADILRFTREIKETRAKMLDYYEKRCTKRQL